MGKVTSINNMFVSTNNLSTLTLTSVPYLKEGTFDTKFADKTVICKLDESSTVYKGENPGFPTVTSVTAPCTLDLTGSAVADYDITRTHNMVNGSCTKCDFSIGDEPASISSLVKTIEKLKDPNSGVTIQTVNEIIDKLLGKEKQDDGNTEDLEE